MAQAPSVQQGTPSRALHWALPSTNRVMSRKRAPQRLHTDLAPLPPSCGATRIHLALSCLSCCASTASVSASERWTSLPRSHLRGHVPLSGAWCTLSIVIAAAQSRTRARKPTLPCAVWNNRAVPNTHLMTQ